MTVGCRCRGAWLLPTTVAACLIAAAPAWAQSTAVPSERCFDEEAAAAHRITACTQLIETSKDNATRAQAFLQRGVLREQGGESETAVTD